MDEREDFAKSGKKGGMLTPGKNADGGKKGGKAKKKGVPPYFGKKGK